MKKCFGCNQTKSFSEFYRHSAMSDGHLNKCKSCKLADTHSYRDKNIDKIKAYDRERGLSDKRKDIVKEYHQTENGKLLSFAAKKRWADKNKIKRQAQSKVALAMKNGTLLRLPCEKCARPDSEAHHEDYNLPLDVIWLARSTTLNSIV